MDEGEKTGKRIFATRGRDPILQGEDNAAEKKSGKKIIQSSAQEDDSFKTGKKIVQQRNATAYNPVAPEPDTSPQRPTKRIVSADVKNRIVQETGHPMGKRLFKDQNVANPITHEGAVDQPRKAVIKVFSQKHGSPNEEVLKYRFHRGTIPPDQEILSYKEKQSQMYDQLLEEAVQLNNQTKDTYQQLKGAAHSPNGKFLAHIMK